MHTYEKLRLTYKPELIAFLLIAESPPPSSAIQSSRQFYYTDHIRQNDRLFINTIRALYPATLKTPEAELEVHKDEWLQRLKADGFYMIEALETSQPHEATKQERQAKIAEALPTLIERVKKLASPKTKIILIKSNVFDVAAEPLRKAGFTVLNTELVDYPGQFNQRDYREKLAQLIEQHRQ
jgi:hypothetical protein